MSANAGNGSQAQSDSTERNDQAISLQCSRETTVMRRIDEEKPKMGQFDVRGSCVRQPQAEDWKRNIAAVGNVFGTVSGRGYSTTNAFGTSIPLFRGKASVLVIK